MNRDNRDERWNERRNRNQRDDQYSNWQNTNQQMDDNRNRGGFIGSPGSNYAAGSFSGAAYGRGLTEDNYRGYNNTGSQQGNFASNYNAAYGDMWNDPRFRNTDENREDNGRRRVTYFPDNDDNRRSNDRDYQSGPYGTSGHYGNLSNQEKTGAYSSDYGYQRSGQDFKGSGMERLKGGHRGKGPRGYQRSDERILEDVNDRLSDDGHVDASGIDVKIENGTIILSGQVPDRNAKRRAEEIAESVRGVNNVENRLRVGEGMMENAAKAITSTIGDVTVGHDKGRR